MASPAPRNGFLEAGDTITRSYKSILDLIQKNSIPHRAKSDCVVWWRGGYISLRVSSLNSGLRKCAYFIKKIGTSVIERLAVMVGWLGYFFIFILLFSSFFRLYKSICTYKWTCRGRSCPCKLLLVVRSRDVYHTRPLKICVYPNLKIIFIYSSVKIGVIVQRVKEDKLRCPWGSKLEVELQIVRTLLHTCYL